MSTSKQLIKIITFCSLFIILTSFSNKKEDDKNYHVKLQIINEKSHKINNFLVKIAKNNSDRERGLMGVEKLSKNYGMVFEFDNEKMIFMWMKDTKIPLDMIFFNKKGQITHIHHQAQPESLEIISSKYPASRVLEINAGLAKELKNGVIHY